MVQPGFEQPLFYFAGFIGNNNDTYRNFVDGSCYCKGMGTGNDGSSFKYKNKKNTHFVK